MRLIFVGVLGEDWRLCPSCQYSILDKRPNHKMSAFLVGEKTINSALT
jgi:hypothetical protein